jgi:UDP-glucose 4-epimerase
MAEAVLVTGGAGYIGSVVVSQLVAQGYRVIVYDNLSKGHRASVPSNATFIQGDISDRAALDRLFRDNSIDAVMHFAASIEAGESMQVPEKYFRNNGANTLTLLEAVIAHKIQRFVFSSTAALFGTPERSPIEENDKLQPTNAYGASKLLVEQMLAWFNLIPRAAVCKLALFQRCRCGGESRRRSSARITPDSFGVAGGSRPA